MIGYVPELSTVGLKTENLDFNLSNSKNFLIRFSFKNLSSKEIA